MQELPGSAQNHDAFIGFTSMLFPMYGKDIHIMMYRKRAVHKEQQTQPAMFA